MPIRRADAARGGGASPAILQFVTRDAAAEQTVLSAKISIPVLVCYMPLGSEAGRRACSLLAETLTDVRGSAQVSHETAVNR